MAALLGAEEFAFGTAALVAIGCDMARQCHLDTCPTGIATQREDLRAKFAGTPDDVVRYFTAIAEDLRRELAAAGARSVGEIVGEGRRLLRAIPAARAELAPVIGAGPWAASPARRADPSSAGRDIGHAPASALEVGIAAAFRGQGSVTASGLRVTTADRSFGAGLTGALERGELHGPIRLELVGAAGQSFGAFAGPGVELRLVGQANDYVAKGLAGGTITVAPEPDLAADAASEAIAGNTVLYGATGGRLHLVGRAGMRFAVRNSGAEAVVEGIGAHGCEYMTGGTVVVLGPVGANFGAGMTGGRAYLYDPTGRHTAALDVRSVAALRLASAVADRAGWPGPRSRARRAPRSAPQGGLDARRAPAARARPGRARLAGRADRGAGARGHANGRRRAARRRRPIGHRRAIARGRVATRPQPHRARTGADAGSAGRYLRPNMGQRHPRVIGPCVLPVPGTPSPEGVTDDPSLRLQGRQRVRRPRRPRCAGDVRRLRLPPDRGG